MRIQYSLLGMIFGLGVTLSASAADLLTIYQQALQNDPTVLQAQATRNANQEIVPQSRAGLLPNLNASASSTSTHINDQQPNAVTGITESNSSNANGYQLSLTQPLFNFQNWMKLRAANDTAKQADATYNAALQDLIIRVANAYFGVLAAEDNLRYTTAYKQATANQLKQVREQYQVGLKTMTDVYQAQATYDSLVSQEITAQNAIVNSMEALRQITGQTYATLDPLLTNLPLITPQPNDPVKWTSAAEQNNWTLLATRFAEQAAKENIRVNYAGHFPTVNAVGQYQNGKNLGFGTPNINQWQSNVGVQVNLPLFQGGLVNSQTRQAQDQYVATSEQLEATYRQVILNTQTSFNNVMAGISKIQADRIAVTSTQSALESMRAGFQAGTKTLLDVLTAQQNLFQAQATLSADQYAYINNTLALKQAAGTLNGQDIVEINRWLQHTA